MGIHLCVQIHGTILLWVYLCFADSLLSSFFTMSPAWGRPYMPFGYPHIHFRLMLTSRVDCTDLRFRLGCCISVV